MDDAQVLAFRIARSGLAARDARDLAGAARCPASDFARDAALLALAARAEGVTREAFRQAVDAGDLVLAHVVRGAIHAVAPGDFARYGRALVADDEDELATQLGRQVRALAAERGRPVRDALEEVTAATTDALAGGRALDKDGLHEALRQRVGADLLPWCRGCQSHHVPPMLWRYATVAAGVRMDGERRYVRRRAGRKAPAREVVPRFLGFYGPAKPGDLAEWAGLARGQAERLWDAWADDLAEVRVGRGRAWIMRDDLAALEDPPPADGLRLLPPGDPALQKPNRALLVPDAALAKRLFRPVASPGVVLAGGRVAGLWRSRARGRRVEVTVEAAGRLPKAALADEVERLGAVTGAEPRLVTA